jgi:hypothetical protein
MVNFCSHRLKGDRARRVVMTATPTFPHQDECYENDTDLARVLHRVFDHPEPVLVQSLIDRCWQTSSDRLGHQQLMLAPIN